MATSSLALILWRFLVNHYHQSISVVSFQQVAGHWALFCFGFLSEHERPWARRAPHARRAFRRYCTRRTNPWASTWPNRQFHCSAKHRNRIRWHDLAAVLPSFRSASRHYCIPSFETEQLRTCVSDLDASLTQVAADGFICVFHLSLCTSSACRMSTLSPCTFLLSPRVLGSRSLAVSPRVLGSRSLAVSSRVLGSHSLAVFLSWVLGSQSLEFNRLEPLRIHCSLQAKVNS